MDLEAVLLDQNRHWRNEAFPYGIEREIKIHAQKLLETKHVLVITGVRRSGKSYLLFQIMNDLLAETKPENILFINFDDPSLLPLTMEDNPLNEVYRTFIQLKNPSGKMYLFLDEIQNVPNWEKWIKTKYDQEAPIKFIITGSNATLLSAEMSTLLTGRNVKIEIFPFSFSEFLTAQEQEVHRNGNMQDIYEQNFHQRDVLQHYLQLYSKFGSFPEVVLLKDDEVKIEILKNYFQDIIYRDIVPRFEIRQSKKLENLAYHLLTNISNNFSFHRLGKSIGIHENTAKEFISYFEKSYLLFSLSRFHYSTAKQLKSPKKAYCVDLGFRTALSFQFSEDFGRLAENLVFLSLFKQNLDCYYWKAKKEVDFVIRKGTRVSNLIQVCWDFRANGTRKRETGGLLEASRELGIPKGIIITKDNYHTEVHDDFEIKYIPLWLWLL